VLRQARELGAVQLGISGGEPLVRDDVEMMVASCSLPDQSYGTFPKRRSTKR